MLQRDTASHDPAAVREIRVVDWVDTKVQVVPLRRSNTQRASDTDTYSHLDSAVLIFDVPENWVWQPATPPPAHADASCTGGTNETSQVRGRWADTSLAKPAGYVPTLDEIIGTDTDWMGTYKVDRHSELYLTKILTQLGSCTEDLLSLMDTSRITRIMHELHARPCSSPFVDTENSAFASRAHVPCAHDDMAAARATTSTGGFGAANFSNNNFDSFNPYYARPALSLQAIADCIELQSGTLKTDTGIFFHLYYRLKLPSEEKKPAVDDEGVLESSPSHPRHDTRTLTGRRVLIFGSGSVFNI